MKRKGKLSGVILIVIMASLGGLVGFSVAKSGFKVGNELSDSIPIAMLILFVPAFFIVIAFHEAGHAFAGSKVGFDFRMYVVGPFMWDKESNGWKFKWNKSVNLAGGLVICLPKGEHNLSKRFSIYAVGGPIASVLLILLAYGGYVVTDVFNTNHYVSLQIVSSFFLLLAILSAFIFVATAIPMQMSGFATDGARVLRLLRGGDSARFETLIVKIVASTTSGMRPKDLSLSELEEAQSLAAKLNAPFGVYIHSYFHQFAFDKGDIEKAEYYIQQYVNEAERVPEGVRSTVWLDAAFFYAYAKRDLDTASLYWNKFKPSVLISKTQIYATEAAISFLKNESVLAITKLEAAMNELPNMMDKGMAAALREKLNRLRNNAGHLM